MRGCRINCLSNFHSICWGSNAMKQLAILGASGHGKVVAEAALRSGWDGVDFYDDAWPEKRKAGKWVVSGDTAALLKALGRFDGVIVAIDGNAIHMEKI